MDANCERTQAQACWETIYRWDWFRREQWLPKFRWVRQALSQGVPSGAAPKAASLGSSNPGLHWTAHQSAVKSAFIHSLLDCSCGLGLKTIIFSDLGLQLSGSDGCALAVENACALAHLEEKRIPYFHSEWSELPRRTEQRFDGVFCDGLMWLPSADEIRSALQGIGAVLRPGGVLLFSGAPFDLPEQPAAVRTLGEPSYRLSWTHTQAEVRCSCVELVRQLPEHEETSYVFLIDADRGTRIETATLRPPVSWTAALTAELLNASGFAKWETRRFDAPGQRRIPFNFAWK